MNLLASRHCITMSNEEVSEREEKVKNDEQPTEASVKNEWKLKSHLDLQMKSVLDESGG